MFSPNQEIAGCPCQFPESVFFVDGKPIMIAKTDKKFEGNLVCNNQANKLGLQELRLRFAHVIKEKREDTKNVIQLIQ